MTTTGRRIDTGFVLRVLAIAIVALAVRIAYIWFWRKGLPVGGDSLYYHDGANLLAKGKGFIDPFQFAATGKSVQAADHPPLYMMYLAVFSFFGATSVTTHLVLSACLGVGTVVVLAFVGRELGGARIAYVAAALAALNPNLWAYDGGLESETMAQLAVALTLLAAYLWWRAPTRAHVALLGAAVALCGLARAELIALALVLVVPLVIMRDGLERPQRWRQLAVGCIATALVVAPWCAYNLARFDRPELLSNGFGFALDSGTCDDVFYGDLLGYWSRACILEVDAQSGLPADADRSVIDSVHRDHAFEYLRGHLSRVPVVVAARLGRITGLFRLQQQVQLDNFVGGREVSVVWASWYWFWALALLSIPGGIILRRRQILVYPLVAVLVLGVVTTAAFFALFRYRAAADVTLVLLAAVALDAAVRRLWPSSPVADRPSASMTAP
jgi:4-amino-4-deoxy-L-arabinose transferase-like glycosyltransferase